MQPSEEIKSKLDIADVIREYIQLKPAGVNFRANCPFHNEKTPSFYVSPERQMWHCFGCSKGGDLFSFVMEMENMSFVEALRHLAPRAGVLLQKTDPAVSTGRNRLLDIVALSAKYYHKVLMESNVAKAARKYLAGRGLTDETIRDWQIGFSPDSWDDLMNLLRKNGYRDDEILRAGMAAKNQQANRIYNRFRGRIMFPIVDIAGNFVAFTARVSPEAEGKEQMGKYINSPQSEIFDKSKILFGLHKAKQEIKKQEFVIIVEGQMDVITSHQAGYANTVASSGTAITSFQIEILKRYTDNFIFALDADAAGQSAIEKGGEAAVPGQSYADAEDEYGRMRRYLDPRQTVPVNIKVAQIPQGKDPDDFIRHNPQAWADVIAEAMPLMEYYFRRITAGLDMTELESRKTAVKKFLPRIAMLADEIDRNFWLTRLSQSVRVDERILREHLKKIMDKKSSDQQRAFVPVRPASPPASSETSAKGEILSEAFLALLLKFENLAQIALDRISIEQLAGSKNKDIYKKFIIYYNNVEKDANIPQWPNGLVRPQNGNFLLWWQDEFQNDALTGNDNEKKSLDGHLRKLILKGERDLYSLDEGVARQEFLKISQSLRIAFLDMRIREAGDLITQLEVRARIDHSAKDELDMVMTELKLIMEEKKLAEANQ